MEILLALVSGVLAQVTLIWEDWIEIIFGVEPDQGTGELEWLITGAFALAAIACASLALFERHRRKALIATSSPE